MKETAVEEHPGRATNTIQSVKQKASPVARGALEVRRAAHAEGL